ncbi:MAG: type I 3-dehydroquinate dehydratase [Faecalibacterium sp.]|jgi:3-dehydroquinate dehydratase-1|nr:type I 3-dehydroquinate dehydratase [Faecalibacterium sp.]
MHTVEIRGVALGDGIPKVIVPLCETDAAALLEQARALGTSEADLIEWRVDALDGAKDAAVVLALLPDVRAALGQKPLLATCRTARDGGTGPVDARYPALVKLLCESGQIDLVDIELSAGNDMVHEMVAAAHANHVTALVSWHDFSTTPPQAEMIDRLRRMQALGADIIKLAVMPRCRADVAALLGATAEIADRHPEIPIISMSMGPLGRISRLAGEAFGSCATFATAGRASAPGQPTLEQARALLKALHTDL